MAEKNCHYVSKAEEEIKELKNQIKNLEETIEAMKKTIAFYVSQEQEKQIND